MSRVVWVWSVVARGLQHYVSEVKGRVTYGVCVICVCMWDMCVCVCVYACGMRACGMCVHVDSVCIYDMYECVWDVCVCYVHLL